MSWTNPAGWLVGFSDCADCAGLTVGAGVTGPAPIPYLNKHTAYQHLVLGMPRDFRVPVQVNPRDAGGNVNLTLVYASFAYGTLGDQGALERGGTYTVPRELGIAISGLGVGTLS